MSKSMYMLIQTDNKHRTLIQSKNFQCIYIKKAPTFRQ